MACCVKCSKRMKICCGVTAVIVVLLVVILVVLIFTVFKPKDPTITLQSVKVEGLGLTLPTFEFNMSLGVLVTVENHNPGSFSYHNNTAYLNYRGNLVAESHLLEDTIPANGVLNISTTLDFYVDDLRKIKDLVADYFSGVINFTSTSNIAGDVKILNFIKFKASSSSICDLSIFVHEKSVNATCNYKFKL